MIFFRYLLTDESFRDYKRNLSKLILNIAVKVSGLMRKICFAQWDYQTIGKRLHDTNSKAK
jgi:hypothetical protein